MNPIIWFEKHNKISWTITILIAIIIFYLSSKTFPTTATPTTNFLSIAYHFFAFFFLAFFLLISLIKGKINKPLFAIAILIAVLYGISDEIHQYFVPGRFSSLKDVLINSTGILFASVVYGVRLRKLL